ncbi:potassium channel AKT2/3-like [Protopterus annectens]|uniref:potassium channel AKT2/3-like n=1 Tax=Protopterus annectens TaxID=7888 RepID=UPI001CF9506E|nr:potassium channel AKT2/3-like [Protopterus annectens]
MTAMSLTENYIICIYWSIVTFATVGYGDIHAENSLEALFCVLLMFISLLALTGIIICGISSIVTNLDAQRGSYYYRLEVIEKSMVCISNDLFKRMLQKCKIILCMCLYKQQAV